MLLLSDAFMNRSLQELQCCLSRNLRVTHWSNKGTGKDKTAEKAKPKTQLRASDLLGKFTDDAAPQKNSRTRPPLKMREKREVSSDTVVGSQSEQTETGQPPARDNFPPKPIIGPSVLLDAFSHMFSVDRTEKSKGLRFNCKLPEPTKLNLFVRDPLSLTICTEPSTTDKAKCPVFDSVEALELSLLSSSAPLNQFEEWIQWTQEGKLWRFPIDNEQDWEEKSVPFHEHTFLEKHLDKNLLKSGPLSVFLELVCHGLAQNPHFTVDQKREHLQWYAAYFKDKIPAIEASVQEEKRLAELERKARGT